MNVYDHYSSKEQMQVEKSVLTISKKSGITLLLLQKINNRCNEATHCWWPQNHAIRGLEIIMNSDSQLFVNHIISIIIMVVPVVEALNLNN